MGRITVDEALQHPYVNVWYEPNEVEGLEPDVTFLRDFDDDSGYALGQWKKLIWDQVTSFSEPDFAPREWDLEQGE